MPGTSACVIRAGTGLANASFTIGNVLPGQYVIQVTGNEGDEAAALLNVISGPAIFLTPATAQPGTHVRLMVLGSCLRIRSVFLVRLRWV